MTFPPQGWAEYQRHRSEIAELLDPRCHTIDWLDVQMLGANALAFGNVSAVIVTEVRRYPAGATELHGLVAAGDLSGVLALIDEAEEWGRSRGLTFACIASRPGWARVLRDRGYAVHQTELRKELG
ncbi:MAG: hypothetical protein ACOYBT_09930 [Polynucleobacter sp.]